MRYNKSKKQVVQSMEIEFGYIFCEFCHTSNAFSFDVHHIFFRSEKPNHPNLHHVKNLIVVCRKCHNRLHRNKRLRNDLVKDRQLLKLFKNK